MGVVLAWVKKVNQVAFNIPERWNRPEKGLDVFCRSTPFSLYSADGNRCPGWKMFVIGIGPLFKKGARISVLQKVIKQRLIGSTHFSFLFWFLPVGSTPGSSVRSMEMLAGMS